MPDRHSAANDLLATKQAGAVQTASRRASDRIADDLIAEIRSGLLPEGEPLPTERDLCQRFHASRPTVRDALRQVQMRGFLRGGAGRRPRVMRPDLNTVLMRAGAHLNDVFGDTESRAHLEQMRVFIETGAAREAARRGDNAQLAKLQAALLQNRSAIGTDDFAQTDIAFHRVLVSVVGNPVILTLHDLFVSRLLATRHTHDAGARADQDRIAHDEHTAVFAAIAAGDVATATDVMERHLNRSYRARLLADQNDFQDDFNKEEDNIC